MRFQRRKSLLGDFIRLNVSGSGLSVSIGVPGARVHVPLMGKSRKPGFTAGIPGTGLSHTQKIDLPKDN